MINKVAIYCRVSTQDQNVDKQEELCKRHCEIQGWDVFKVYKDVYSGTAVSRPSFNELLEDMRHYRFNTIVVMRLDRIGRSLQHLLILFREFDAKGVQFVSITQNIDTTTSTGKLQMQMLGAFAEFERNLISERTKEGLRFAKNVGKRGKDKKPRKRAYKRTPLFQKETFRK